MCGVTCHRMQVSPTSISSTQAGVCTRVRFIQNRPCFFQLNGSDARFCVIRLRSNGAECVRACIRVWDKWPNEKWKALLKCNDADWREWPRLSADSHQPALSFHRCAQQKNSTQQQSRTHMEPCPVALWVTFLWSCGHTLHLKALYKSISYIISISESYLDIKCLF